MGAYAGSEALSATNCTEAPLAATLLYVSCTPPVLMLGIVPVMAVSVRVLDQLDFHARFNLLPVFGLEQFTLELPEPTFRCPNDV